MQKQARREELRWFSLTVSALVSVLASGCADGVAGPSHPVASSEADGGGAGAAVVAERIAFTLGPWGFASDIGSINPDGSGLVNLTMSPEPEMMGGWSPDGSSILFVRGVSPEEFHVWRMNPDGSGQEQLTAGPGVRLAPTSSPDGNHILYMQSSDLSAADADIYMADADGSNPVQLTDEPGPDGCPRSSPDGMRIVFSSARSGGTALDLFTMAPDGSDVVQLTQVKGTELCELVSGRRTNRLWTRGE